MHDLTQDYFLHQNSAKSFAFNTLFTMTCPLPLSLYYLIILFSLKTHLVSAIQIRRLCKTCKILYSPNENNIQSCQYHNGRYIGAEMSKHYGTKSGGIHTGLSLSWDCCDAEDYNASGCKRGLHVSYDDNTPVNFMMNSDSIIANMTSQVTAADNSLITTTDPASYNNEVRASVDTNNLMVPTTKPLINNKTIAQEMLSVGIPSIAACIVEPLLTVVDTLFIGRFSLSLGKREKLHSPFLAVTYLPIHYLSAVTN